MKAKRKVVDSDVAGAERALHRAATRARQLAEQTGTPFYVWKDGRVVDLQAQSSDGVSRRGRRIVNPKSARPKR